MDEPVIQRYGRLEHLGNSEWKKKLTTECIENVIMMMPFSATLIWTFGERQRMIWKGIKITFVFLYP